MGHAAMLAEAELFDIEDVFNDDYLYFYAPLLTRERTQQEADTVSSLLALEADEAVLDIGCELLEVVDGQVIELECDDDCEVDFDEMIPEIESEIAILIVTATDECGNVGTCELDLCALVGDDDDDDEDDDDDDDDDD